MWAWLAFGGAILLDPVRCRGRAADLVKPESCVFALLNEKFC